MNQEIESEIIEKHAVIVGRIYALNEAYKKRLEDVQEKVKRFYETKGIDDNNFQWYGGLQTQLIASIRDLEELSK